MAESRHPISHSDFGRFVWAKYENRFWPGLLVSHSQCHQPPLKKPNEVYIYWYGETTVSGVDLGKLEDFFVDFDEHFSARNLKILKNYMSSLHECLKDCKLRSTGSSFKDSFDELLEWAQKGFPTRDGYMSFLPGVGDELPQRARICLSRRKGSKYFPENSSSETDSDASCAAERQRWKPKASILDKVRRGEMSIEDVCVACSSVRNPVVCRHPKFEGGLCSDCMSCISTDLGKEDNEECCICFSPGHMAICDVCDSFFCFGCIELLVSIVDVDKIQRRNPWECFICEPYYMESHGLIKVRQEYLPTFQVRNANTVQEKETFVPIDKTPDISTFLPKRKIRVLSLFDGIGAGFMALDKLGIDVDSYFASEIDTDALMITKVYFGDRICDIGDVTKVTEDMVAKMAPIDLVIGGSPCNDLSFVNANRKGLYDPKGTGHLFFHYHKVLQYVKLANKDHKVHTFFMFENVLMAAEWRDVISSFFERPPTVIDAANFSCQKRRRNFWGNIPEMYCQSASYGHKVVKLNDQITKIFDRKAIVEKSNCITTNMNSHLVNGESPVRMNGIGSTFFVTEIEKIFGFPVHYTDGGNTDLKKRRQLLGKSWSIDVIVHIFGPLKKYFLCKDVKEFVAPVGTNKDQVSSVTRDKEVSASSEKSSVFSGINGGIGSMELMQPCLELMDISHDQTLLAQYPALSSPGHINNNCDNGDEVTILNAISGHVTMSDNLPKIRKAKIMAMNSILKIPAIPRTVIPIEVLGGKRKIEANHISVSIKRCQSE